MPEAAFDPRPRPRLGLALGGGAARGLAHIGVVRALREAGVRIDLVAGTSMGALVGAFVAGDGFEAFADRALRLDAVGVARLVDVRPGDGGLVQGGRLLEQLCRLQPDRPIETFARRFAAVATDFGCGRAVLLDRGPWSRAVRASIALPGLLSPVFADGRWLVDGGLVDPVPVAAARALGADVVVAVDVDRDLLARRTAPAAAPADRRAPELLQRLLPELPAGLHELARRLVGPLSGRDVPAPGYFDLVYGAILIMQDRIARSGLAGDPPDLLITPRVGHIGLFEFHRAAEAAACGEEATRALLPVLRLRLDDRPPAPPGMPRRRRR